MSNSEPTFTVSKIKTSWDDLLEGIDTIKQWADKRSQIQNRFHELLLNEAAPDKPKNLQLKVERSWDAGDFTIEYVSYQVETDERAHAYVGIPNGSAPEGGFPAVICLHGTTNWGARRTLGLGPEPGDPDEENEDGQVVGKDYARQLVRAGFITISPEHFCCASRCPEEGPYDTKAFYAKHPNWSAVGKYMHDSRIALDVLCAREDVNEHKVGVTGHSLGGQGSIWLGAIDDRLKCVAPSCSANTFRENSEVLHWSRDFWYVYFPQLREKFLAGETIECDFHEQMSLIAPTPLLDRFALNDGDWQNMNHRTQLHLKLRDLYRLYGAENAHAYMVFGDGHSVPQFSSDLMISWMKRWLVYDGDPLGTWDSSITPSA